MKKNKVKKGDRYGKLVILKEIEGYRFPSGGIKRKFECKCDCGTISYILLGNLKSGRNQSCGCNVKKHGMSYSKTHKKWDCMIQRCTNPNSAQFKNYGGRGITVCKEWKSSFETFFRDMGEAPEGLTLERIDNDKDYYKENCRWATTKEQNRNRRFNKFITFNGKTKCVAEWAEEIKIGAPAIYRRLKTGWNPIKALTEPVRLSARVY